jgi:hypothetical protein
VKVGTPILRLLIGLHEVDLYRDNLGSIFVVIINEFFLCSYAVSVIGHMAVMSDTANRVIGSCYSPRRGDVVPLGCLCFVQENVSLAWTVGVAERHVRIPTSLS